MTKIDCKFVEKILAPHNAFASGLERGKRCLTSDGVEVEVHPEIVWDNSDGMYNDELEEKCQKMFHVPFSVIRSTWIARLGNCSNYWHQVKLVKVETA